MDVQTSLRLPAELRSRIGDIATQDRRSVNTTIVILIEEAVARRQADALDSLEKDA